MMRAWRVAARLPVPTRTESCCAEPVARSARRTVGGGEGGHVKPGFMSPGKVVAVGRNYALHAAELGSAVPKEPLIFLKPPSSVIGDGEAIVLPPESARVEHEGEIGVVIGRRLRRATDAEARAAITGITCVNDVTARDLQRSDEQWTRAKGFDTFCPIGPRVVPIDPGRLEELEVRCRVNGTLRQHGRARD